MENVSQMNPNSTNMVWREKLTRELFWPNIVVEILYRLTRIVARMSGGGKRKAHNNLASGVLAIEAGQVAWEHIFFQEAFQSAVEFLGPDHVVKLAVSRKRSYLRQVKKFVMDEGVTHYFYDPRTGSQSFFFAVMQALFLAVFFSRKNIVPIAYCTDISLRRWRFQAAIVTAVTGLCVCLTRDDIARRMFPHERLIGPALMPLSKKTFKELEELRKARKPHDSPKVSFFGSLYEPRVSQLDEIRRGVEAEGLTFEIKGRDPGGQRISDADYWREIVSSDILVSTSSQVQMKGMDLGHVNHLIYRFTEALACGVCLVIEDAPGVERHFLDFEDLILWRNTDEAIAQIVRLVQNPSDVSEKGLQGFRRMQECIRQSVFWSEIQTKVDSLHGRDSR